jgi:hypothetical protein
MPISDLTAGNATLACSLVDVTGHPNGNRNMREISIDRPVTCSTGDMSPEMGVAFAAKSGVQILPTKMDFKTKYDSMGAFIKDKARLVVLGNLEWETLQDYFSPTAHTKTLNLLLALAVEHNFILFGLDIYGAFITADIDELVYVSLPKGLPTKHGTDRIWKLKKTLYGLKRSPRTFFDSLSAHLLAKGYLRSANDPCLFFQRVSPTEVIVFCIHVDDFAIAASHQHLIQQLKEDLKDNGYIITESDTLETFLECIFILSAVVSIFTNQDIWPKYLIVQKQQKKAPILRCRLNSVIWCKIILLCCLEAKRRRRTRAWNTFSASLCLWLPENCCARVMSDLLST